MNIIPLCTDPINEPTIYERLICTTDLEQNETIKHGSLTLWIDTSNWEENKVSHAVNNATVYSIADNYQGELKVGDRLYGNHLFCHQDDRFKHEGQIYINVPVDEVYLYIRDGEIHMMPGKLIVEVLYHDVNLGNNIILPFAKQKDKTAKVLKCHPDDKEVKEGDIIYYKKNADFNMKIEDKDYVCIWSRPSLIAKFKQT